MSAEPHPLAGAIPYRRISGGRIEILLIAPRGVDAWRIPHRPLEPGAQETDEAARAALEEAGVRGTMGKEALGSYVCRLEHGHARVRVFPLEITDLSEEWKAMPQLERQWFRGNDAIGEISISGLREVVLRFLDQARRVASWEDVTERNLSRLRWVTGWDR